MCVYNRWQQGLQPACRRLQCLGKKVLQPRTRIKFNTK
jgi:hypothetical protein